MTQSFFSLVLFCLWNFLGKFEARNFLGNFGDFSVLFPRVLWIRQGQKILGNFEVFLDKSPKKPRKRRTGCFRDLFRFAPFSADLFRIVFRTNQGNPFPKNLLRLFFRNNLARQKIASKNNKVIFMLVLKGLVA